MSRPSQSSRSSNDLRERVWACYGLQIEQVLREQRCTDTPTPADEIDEADAPF